MIDSARSRTQFLGDARIWQLIRRLSIPAIASMAAVALFQIVDAVFVGALGTSALGAVSVAFPLFTIVGGIGQAFGTGAASWISRSLGEGRYDDSSKTASASIVGVCLAGGFLLISVLLFLKPLLTLLGATPTILPFAISYSRIVVFGSLVVMANTTLASIARSEGNARRGMYSVLLSSSLNITLDPICIFVLGLGISGAAIATLVAQLASFLFLSSFHLRKVDICRVRLGTGFRELRRVGKVLHLGMPGFFLQLLGAVAIALVNNATMRYGDAAVAAAGLAFRILALGAYPIYGFTSGIQPVAGYNYGARNYPRVFQAIRTTVVITGAFSVCFSFLLLARAPAIVGGFSSDAAVVAVGARMVRAASVLFPLFGLQIVLAVLFQAIGYALPAALLVLSRQGIFFIPAILVLPEFLGLDGVILSQPLCDLLTSALGAGFAVRILGRLRREARGEQTPRE